MAKSLPQNSTKKKTLREKAEKQKKPAIKAVLQNPFKTVWPSITLTKQQEVLEHLERFLRPLNGAADACKDKKEKKIEELKAVDPIAMKIRSEFVVGVNEVTKLLEKDKLSLVLACKSAQPPIIVKHLAELSAVRCCPAMLLAGLDSLLCSKLKIRSALAIGFKKKESGNGYFEEFISFVDPPEIPFPYLNNHVAKFTIDTKGERRRFGRIGCENTDASKRFNNSRRKKPLRQNQSQVTAPVQTSVSKCWPPKSINQENPFKSNENFISLGSISDDKELKGLNLSLRHTNTQNTIWDEIFAMRIVDKRNSKGVASQRNNVSHEEILSLKSLTVGDSCTATSEPVSCGKKRKTSRTHSRKKKFGILSEKPEYRVSEIQKIKGNVDKKKMKKENLMKRCEEKSKNLKDKKEKSHLNTKHISKLKKLKKALKKLQNLKMNKEKL